MLLTLSIKYYESMRKTKARCLLLMTTPKYGNFGSTLYIDLVIILYLIYMYILNSIYINISGYQKHTSGD